MSGLSSPVLWVWFRTKEDGWSRNDESISAPLRCACVCTCRCVMSAFVRCQHVASSVWQRWMVLAEKKKKSAPTNTWQQPKYVYTKLVGQWKLAEGNRNTNMQKCVNMATYDWVIMFELNQFSSITLDSGGSIYTFCAKAINRDLNYLFLFNEIFL